MPRKRFTAEQSIRILHEAEAVGNVREVCRQHNMAEQTLYRWRRQCGGLHVNEVKRLRALERENAALQRLVGDLTRDNRMRQEVLGKKWAASRPGVLWPPRWRRRPG
jgi:putative transposase